MTMTPRERIADFDGSRLLHAYGLATDADALTGLFDGDERRSRAVDYLYSAILHQGTPWTATAPIVDLLLDCLPLAGTGAARVDICDFVTDVASVPIADPGSTLDTARAETDEALAALGPEAAAGWAAALETVAVAADGDEAEAASSAIWEDEDVVEYMWLTVRRSIAEGRGRWARVLLASTSDDDPEVALAAARAVAACDPRLTPGIPEGLRDALRDEDAPR